MPDEVRRRLVAIREIAGDPKWARFPPQIANRFAEIYHLAGQAFDALPGAGPARKQLVVLEHPGPHDDKVAEIAARTEQKLAACGLPAEVLVLTGGATLSVFGGEADDEFPAGGEEQPDAPTSEPSPLAS